MRSIARLCGIAVLLLLVGCGAAPLAPGNPDSTQAASLQSTSSATTTSQATSPRTITVSGSASVMVEPDEVMLTLGVETSDLVLKTAKSKNDEAISRVLEVTKGLGIDPKQVQTDYMSLEPRYQDSYTQRTFLGYWVRKNVVITLKDVGKFESLLSQCLEAGITHVQGIEFRTSELRKHRDRARTLAIQAAQEKAEAMAKDAGQEIDVPLTIQEEYTRWYSPYSSWWGGYRGGMTQNVVQNAPSAPAQERDIGLAPGQIAVDASVTVGYKLKG